MTPKPMSESIEVTMQRWRDRNTFDHADAHRIADHACSVLPKVREALERWAGWRGVYDDSANETFDRIAEQFRLETGLLAPGKDAGAFHALDNRKQRDAAWEAWNDKQLAEMDAQIRDALAILAGKVGEG